MILDDLALRFLQQFKVSKNASSITKIRQIILNLSDFFLYIPLMSRQCAV
jgi:hypothetical protein